MHPPKAQEFAILNSRARFYRRVFSAILLYTVIQEKPLNYRVLREFGIEDNLGTGSSNTRGAIQQLQKEASTFCGMVSIYLSSSFQSYPHYEQLLLLSSRS